MPLTNQFIITNNSTGCQKLTCPTRRPLIPSCMSGMSSANRYPNAQVYCLSNLCTSLHGSALNARVTCQLRWALAGFQALLVPCRAFFATGIHMIFRDRHLVLPALLSCMYIYIYIYVKIIIYPEKPVYVSLYLSLSIFLSLYLFLSISLSLSLCVSLSLSLSFSLSFVLFMSGSIFLCFSISFYLCPSIHLFLSLSLYLFLSLYLYLSLSLSLFLSLPLSLS